MEEKEKIIEIEIERLKDFKEHPFQFNRQKPFGCYIVDFYCDKAKLAIELDGSQHYENAGLQYDKERTRLNALAALCLYSIAVRKCFHIGFHETIVRPTILFRQFYYGGTHTFEYPFSPI